MKKTSINYAHLLAIAALNVYKIYDEQLQAFIQHYDSKYAVEKLDQSVYNSDYFFLDNYNCWSFHLDGNAYEKVLSDLRPEDKAALISHMKDFEGWD